MPSRDNSRMDLTFKAFQSRISSPTSSWTSSSSNKRNFVNPALQHESGETYSVVSDLFQSQPRIRSAYTVHAAVLFECIEHHVNRDASPDYARSPCLALGVD